MVKDKSILEISGKVGNVQFPLGKLGIFVQNFGQLAKIHNCLQRSWSIQTILSLWNILCSPLFRCGQFRRPLGRTEMSKNLLGRWRTYSSLWRWRNFQRPLINWQPIPAEPLFRSSGSNRPGVGGKVPTVYFTDMYFPTVACADKQCPLSALRIQGRP